VAVPIVIGCLFWVFRNYICARERFVLRTQIRRLEIHPGGHSVICSFFIDNESCSDFYGSDYCGFQLYFVVTQRPHSDAPFAYLIKGDGRWTDCNVAELDFDHEICIGGSSSYSLSVQLDNVCWYGLFFSQDETNLLPYKERLLAFSEVDLGQIFTLNSSFVLNGCLTKHEKENMYSKCSVLLDTKTPNVQLSFVDGKWCFGERVPTPRKNSLTSDTEEQKPTESPLP